MNCREHNDLLRGGRGGDSDEASNSHRRTCAACRRDARAWELLRLGSSPAADGPREGFERRLRARIDPAEPLSSPVLTWSDGIGLVARPALGLASLALAAALVWGGWAFSGSSSADDFAVLTGGDPAYDVVLAGGLDEMGEADAGATESAGDTR
jgi:hypothetical protein